MEIYADNYRHLICLPYTRENLHEMARLLGINAGWFHSSAGGRLAHYDIPKRRVKEILSREDVRVITTRQMLRLMPPRHYCPVT